jgi:hypothetical protein
MKNPEVFTGGRNARQDVRNNKLKKQFVKRSNVMKYNRFIQIAATIFVALTIVVSGAFAQGNAVLNGTVDNTGLIKVQGALSGATTTLGGTVEFNKAGDQIIPGGYTFNKLTGSGTGAKSIGIAGTGASVTVKDTLTANGVTVSVSNLDSLHLGLVSNLTPIYTTGGGSFVATSGTVVYGGDGVQNIYSTTYHNLYVRAKTFVGTKTAGGNITVTDSLTNLAHITLDFGSNNFTGTTAAIVNTGTLKSSSTVTVDATAVIGGTFEYYGGVVSQAVAPAFYHNLTLTGAGNTHTFSGLTKVDSAYTVAGTRTYTGSTFEYNGASPSQSVVGENNYVNLTLSGGASKKLAGDATITGNLAIAVANDSLDMNNHNISLGGNLTLGSNIVTGAGVLTMTSAIGANVTGTSEVIGIVTRTPSPYVVGTSYAFNNASVIVKPTVVGTLSAFTMESHPLPVTPLLGYFEGNSVNRTYKPTYNGTFTADVQLAYLTPAEYTGTHASKLKFFQGTGDIVKANKIAGSYSIGTSAPFSYVKLATVASTSLMSATELGIDDRFNQFITKNVALADWNTPGTWDMGTVPTPTDDAEINTKNVTLDGSGSVNSLTINSGKDLTLTTASSALTVAAGLTNDGTLELKPGANATVTGTFNNSGTATLTNAGTITVQ